MCNRKPSTHNGSGIESVTLAGSGLPLLGFGMPSVIPCARPDSSREETSTRFLYPHIINSISNLRVHAKSGRRGDEPRLHGPDASVRARVINLHLPGWSKSLDRIQLRIVPVRTSLGEGRGFLFLARLRQAGIFPMQWFRICSTPEDESAFRGVACINYGARGGRERRISGNASIWQLQKYEETRQLAVGASRLGFVL